jgi:hypothetical protein
LFPYSVFGRSNITRKQQCKLCSAPPFGYSSCSNTAYDPYSAKAHIATIACHSNPTLCNYHLATIAFQSIANTANSTNSSKAHIATIAYHSNPILCNYHLATIAFQSIANTANSTNSSKVHIAALAKHPNPNIANHATFSACYPITHHPNHNPFNPHHSNHKFTIPTINP